MLKALRNNGGLLVLGCTPEEVQGLKEGKLLKIDLADVGAPGNGVIVFMGASNEEMKKRFERSELAEQKPGSIIDMSKVRMQ